MLYSANAYDPTSILSMPILFMPILPMLFLPMSLTVLRVNVCCSLLIPIVPMPLTILLIGYAYSTQVQTYSA